MCTQDIFLGQLYVQCRYVRTLNCRMSARVHPKTHAKTASLHRTTIAEVPLLYSVARCREVSCVQQDMVICTCCRSRSLNVECRYVRNPTCHMSAHVHQKPHIKTARLYRITLSILCHHAWTCTSAPAAGPEVWTHSAGMYVSPHVVCLHVCTKSRM